MPLARLPRNTVALALELSSPTPLPAEPATAPSLG